MPLPFRNRKAKSESESTPAAASQPAPPTGTNAPDASMEVNLPAKECRTAVREYVMAAAASVYIHHGVNASMEMHDDPDLNKEAKAQKREEQTAAQDAYKQRLQALYGHSLLQSLSSCLVLEETPSTSTGTSSPSKAPASTTNTTFKEVFASISLLLYNYILSTAGSSPNKSDSNTPKSEGYDARIRTVLRMGCIKLLTETLEREDQPDGILLAKIQASQRKPLNAPAAGSDPEKDSEAPKLQSEESGDTEEVKEQADSEEEIPPEDVHSKEYGNLYRQYATKKFQALEHAIAEHILQDLIDAQNTAKGKTDEDKNSSDQGDEGTSDKRFSRKNLVRAAKIGGVGVVAGTLFAVTGGAAAVALGPAIASTLTALGLGSAAVALVASHTALVALFGVGGGGLSAYKMIRRTDGLTEFEIYRKSHEGIDSDSDAPKPSAAHLHTTVFVSGWLTDIHDFARPWGVTPSNIEKTEILQRYFGVVDPAKIDEVGDFLKPFQGLDDEEKEKELWSAFSSALEEQYGKHPDHLLPLKDRAVELSSEEEIILDGIHRTIMKQDPLESNENSPSEQQTDAVAVESHENEKAEVQEIDPKLRAWDYQSEFGGDLYAVKWESAVLLKMCKVVNNMAIEMASKATQEVLKKTALASVMVAVAWPVLLLNFAGSIDNEWTLVTIRSDLAGAELAKSLLQSEERRPVNLIGFSFGARVIYACLMELARHQQIWEEQQTKEGAGKQTKMSRPRLKWNKNKSEAETIEYTREPASIVQDVVIMGTPIFVSRSSLRACRRMAAGRFVNCYARKDWILSLMFQYKNASALKRGLCGTGPVEGVGGIENYEVSTIISSWHSNYSTMVPEILDFIAFDQPLATDPQND